MDVSWFGYVILYREMYGTIRCLNTRLVTETSAVQKKFNQRTHNCGELNESHTNLDVRLCGWIDNKRSDRFVVLRDGYGITQLIINHNVSHISIELTT